MSGKCASSVHPDELRTYNSQEVGHWLCQIGFRDFTTTFLERDTNGRKLLDIKRFQLRSFFPGDDERATQFWNLLEAIRNNNHSSPKMDQFSRARPPPRPRPGGMQYGGGNNDRYRAPLPPPPRGNSFSDDDENYIKEIDSRPPRSMPFPALPPKGPPQIPDGFFPHSHSHLPPTMPPGPPPGPPDDKPQPQPPPYQAPKPKERYPAAYDDHTLPSRPPPLPPSSRVGSAKSVLSPTEDGQNSMSLAEELKKKFNKANPYLMDNDESDTVFQSPQSSDANPDSQHDLPPQQLPLHNLSITPRSNRPSFPPAPDGSATLPGASSSQGRFQRPPLRSVGSKTAVTSPDSENVVPPRRIHSDNQLPSLEFNRGPMPIPSAMMSAANKKPVPLPSRHASESRLHNRYRNSLDSSSSNPISPSLPLPPPPAPISNVDPPSRPPKSIEVIRKQESLVAGDPSHDPDYQVMGLATDFSKPAEEQPWFLNASRDGAQKAIEANKQTGVFIVRPRGESDSQPYALTVWVKGGFKNLVIRKKSNGEYALGKEKPGELTFKTVVKLIDYFQRNDLNLAESDPVILTTGP